MDVKATGLGAPTVGVTVLPLSSGWMLGGGAALILLGALATALSVAATLVSVVIVGGLLLVAGALEAGAGLADTEWGGLLFVIGGLVRLVVSIAAGLRHRARIALSGFIGLALGLLVWSELPESAVWVIGAFVGIDLMVVGWSWLMLALASRRGPGAGR